jgi:cell wall-associated NlpC family hydrolase
MPVRHPGLRHALTRAAGALTALTVATSGVLVAGATTAPAAAADRYVSQLSVTPAKVTRSVGSPVKFTWTLHRYGTPIANQPVEIYRRATTSSTWTKIGTYTSNADGTVAHAFTVQRSTYAYAKFLGNAKYQPSAAQGVVYAQSSLGQRAITEASRHVGKPYQWGAVGPDRFDCSGYTLYVFQKLGKSLPHNSRQQYSVVRKIAKSSRQIGDLIFSYNSSGIHHVGIYAGNGYMWHSPKSGDVVKKSKIWSSTYYVGRVA